MDRREALRRIALLTGGAISATTVAGVLGGCEVPADDTGLRTLTVEQFDLVDALSERIIPETDTPGASEVGVAFYVDKMATDWMAIVEREHLLSEIDRVRAWIQETYGGSVRDLTPEEQDETLRHFAGEADETEDELVVVEARTAWRGDRDPTEPIVPGTGERDEVEFRLQPFFNILKELTMVGYYTSEPGATQELQYLHVPGRWDGCASLEEVGRTWAM